MSALSRANGLRAVIEQAGGSLKDFTVLSPQVDPYRLDTPANHMVGKWFAEQMERLNGSDKHHMQPASACVVVPY